MNVCRNSGGKPFSYAIKPPLNRPRMPTRPPEICWPSRAWIAFKDKSCVFYANGENGREGEVISAPACRAEVIENRTAELVSIAKDLAPQ